MKLDARVPIRPVPIPEDAGLQRTTAWVKKTAAEHGLEVSAVTSVDPFPEAADAVRSRIDAGHLDGMDWFTHERIDVAEDVRNLHPTARSILSVGLTYWSGPSEKPDDGVPRGRISRYAWGRDYHRVIEKRMKALHADLEDQLGRRIEARFLVDTARVMERAIAARSGLGWYGKHSCIIVPGHGSWILLGELVLDIPLLPDAPLGQDCGRCRICLDQCPTGAIVDAYKVNAPTCISYLTIEERGWIPRELRPKMGDWVYGCDVCQNVCPYTKAAKVTDDADMRPASIENAYPSLPWLLEMTDEEFGAHYFGTPVPRTKRRGLARNAAIALGNIGSDRYIPVLASVLREHDELLVRGHAAWAIGRLAEHDPLTARRALEAARRSEPDAVVCDEIERAMEVPR
ncbi:MAG TPA: tRNA epoxyqueuosine(34) reductase QueG [Thermomicrobiales bacterium]|nr:tRNA epoxyqueuosine(34) reductase QueG [Thermomicrobiales bacterium]